MQVFWQNTLEQRPLLCKSRDNTVTTLHTNFWTRRMQLTGSFLPAWEGPLSGSAALPFHALWANGTGPCPHRRWLPALSPVLEPSKRSSLAGLRRATEGQARAWAEAAGGLHPRRLDLTKVCPGASRGSAPPAERPP